MSINLRLYEDVLLCFNVTWYRRHEVGLQYTLFENQIINWIAS